MPNFTRYFRPVLVVTGLVCTSIICAALVYLVFSLVTSNKTLGYGLWSIGLRDLARAVYEPADDNGGVDSQALSSDVSSISAWVLDCTKAKDVSDFPEAVQHDFGIRVAFERSNDNRSEGFRLPNHQERAILTLSQSLSAQRKTLRAQADSAFHLWEYTSIVSIALGMFTTILVSLSSTEFGRGEGRIQRCVRILAIVFPALGTGAAAVIAFYSPQAEWNQASHTLASLTQLHGQMSVGVWKLPCIDANDNQSRQGTVSALDEWAKRYVDIQTVSTVVGGAGGSGGQQPGTAGGAGGSGGQQPGGAGGNQPGTSSR
jgi:hypothetical protein